MTLYTKQGERIWALAGESPGTSANWLETTDQGFANALAEIHGNSRVLSAGTWNAWKARYLEPVKISGGTTSGVGVSAAEIAKAVNDDASKRMAN